MKRWLIYEDYHHVNFMEPGGGKFELSHSHPAADAQRGQLNRALPNLTDSSLAALHAQYYG